MASTVTTFAIFQALLQRSVAADTSLDTSTRSAIAARVNELPKQVSVVLDQPKATSTQGNVSLDASIGAIIVAQGTPSTPNRVEFGVMTFNIPVRFDGTKGNRGFLVGHIGDSQLTPVAAADISLQYRLLPADPWVGFGRNTVLPEVTKIYFAANIADQAGEGDFALPQLHLYAEQI